MNNTMSRPERFTSWLFQSVGCWRNLLGGALAVGLTIVSVKFNLELAKAMAVDEDSKTLLMSGYGMLDLACVFLAGFVAVKTTSPARRIVAWGLFTFLVLLSLWAACAYSLAIDATKGNEALARAIDQKRSELSTQAANVEIWQRNLDNTERFKTRYTGILGNEQDKYRTIQNELVELEAQRPIPTMAIYHRVGPMIGLEPDNLALVVRIVWSIALVLCPILLLALVAVERYGHAQVPETTNDTPPPNGEKKKRFTSKFHDKNDASNNDGHGSTEPERVHSPLSPVTATAPERVQSKDRDHTITKPVNKGIQHDTGTEGKAGHRYEDLKRSVLSGRTKPSVRAVRSYCQCRQEVARRYIVAMADEGIIEPEGQGWKVRVLRAVK